MPYRTDTFAVGDKVTWADDHYATLTDGRKKHGDGPFTINVLHDREFNSYDYYDSEYGKSNWDSMGHTQHVEIAGLIDSHYSGAFFKKIA